MIVQPDVQLKKLSGASAGELVRLEFGRASALAIVMRQTDQSTVCAFLETEDKNREPFFLAVSMEDAMCMSYGKEWLLDLMFDASTYPGNSQFLDKHGVIHLSETAVAINLDRPPEDIRLSAGAFDLRTFKTVDVHRRAYAPVTSWKIWHTAAAKHQTNAKPLFVFAAS
ncbi:hypothetical protein [Bradyrhizobium guangdongense]|uniref:hypothetical protein n=1 Tax=Bradyrhizobium guangdongense TaxID=1325090 RepID=UPI00131A09D4|nr:hypothetical protein [Bradyrhizobium guangdongense]